MEALRGPSLICKRGRANALHPGSSPKGPPINVEMENTEGEGRLRHSSAGHGPAVSTSAGITTKAVMISNGAAIALTSAALRVNRAGTGQRCSVNRSVMSALKPAPGQAMIRPRRVTISVSADTAARLRSTPAPARAGSSPRPRAPGRCGAEDPLARHAIGNTR